MTPSTPSAPTLLGKLRALELEFKECAYDGSYKAVTRESVLRLDLADLLPDVIAEIERLGKDAARLDSGTIRLSMLDEWGDISATIFTKVNLRAAIDAAMEE